MKIVKYHRKHMPGICNDGCRRQIVVETEFPRVVHYPKIPGRPVEKVTIELSGNTQLEMTMEEAKAIGNALLIASLPQLVVKKPNNKKPENMEPFIAAYIERLKSEIPLAASLGFTEFDDLSKEKIRHDCVSFLKLGRDHLNGLELKKVATIFHACRNLGGMIDVFSLESNSCKALGEIAGNNFKPLLCRVNAGRTALEVSEA